jgi:uncharacterized membrane protein SirB2
MEGRVIEFYPTSNGCTSLRSPAAAVRCEQRGAAGAWPMFAPLRYLSYTIDTVLLTAALMLATILHQYPFVHAWLTVKVLLLVVYIVLGTLALKRARTRTARRWCFAAALLVYLFIISVARAHQPLGIFARLLTN